MKCKDRYFREKVQGVGEMGGWGDGEMGRRGDGEMGGWGDGGGVGTSSMIYRLRLLHSSFDFLRDPGKGLRDVET